MPPFYVFAAVNAWQSGGTHINRFRLEKKVSHHVETNSTLTTIFRSGSQSHVHRCLKIFTAGVGLALEDLALLPMHS
jgi:hypothetical protein